MKAVNESCGKSKVVYRKQKEINGKPNGMERKHMDPDEAYEIHKENKGN